jgi:hypothetical protein
MTEWFSSLFGSSSGDPTESSSTPTRDSVKSDPKSSDPSMQDRPKPDGAAANGEPDDRAAAVSISPEQENGPISGITYTIQTKEEPNRSRPFAHGFIDGLEGVDRDVFERFLTQSSEQARLNEKLEALSEKEASLLDEREERIDREARIQENAHRLEDLNEKTTERRERYQRLEGLVQSHEQRYAPADPDAETETAPAGDAGSPADSSSQPEETVGAAPSRGSLLYAILYSIAGLLFVAGDIIMSREVVSRALRLQGDLEPWIFAIGLAMLAVLMKPAYDRLVEKPYWNGDIRWFRVTILIGVVAAALTLGVLGAFRADAFETNQKIARLQQELSTGVTGNSMSGAEATQLQEQIAQLQQSIAGSWLGFTSFVLSGVLFAAAGAVCLGIGFRHSRDWYHRSIRPHVISGGERAWAWWTERRLKARYDEAKDDYRRIRSRRDDVQAQLEAERTRLDCMRPLREIRADLQEVRGEKEQLQATRWVGAGNQGIEAYRNGYDIADAVFTETGPNGQRSSRTGARSRGDGTPSSEDVDVMPSGSEEATETEGDSPETASPEQSSSESDTDSSGSNTDDSTSSRRPFLAVRDAISRNQIR